MKRFLLSLIALSLVLVFTGNAHADRYTRQLKKEVEEGNTHSMYLLGCEYEKGMRHLWKDSMEQAVELYQKAADGGELDAFIKLGGLYEEGKGVKRDPAKAAGYWERAVTHANWGLLSLEKQGKVYFKMGRCYRTGTGFRRDYHRAIAYYKKAVDCENTDAMLDLGECAYKGEGLPKNYSVSKAWYGKACDRGEQRGCNGYRMLSEHGY